MTQSRVISHGVETATLADILERVLDKGIVIAGDIKIKLVDVELLTIQIRLVICSVEKAKEMGMDWWVKEPALSSMGGAVEHKLAAVEERLDSLEKAAGAKEKAPFAADSENMAGIG